MMELGGVGAECVVNRQCQTGLWCDVADYTPNTGICTRPCTPGSCPIGSRCTPVAVDIVDGELVDTLRCLPQCTRAVGSRGGCPGLGWQCANDGVCRGGCGLGLGCAIGTCEVGTGRCLFSGSVPHGGACSSTEECAGPSALCNDGRCMGMDCDIYPCDPGEVCVAQSDGGSGETRVFSCATECVAGVDVASASDTSPCRSGQICRPPEFSYGDVAGTGFCASPFSSGGGGWAGYQNDGEIGSLCTDGSSCPSAFGYGVCLGNCTIVGCALPSLAHLDLCGPEGVCIDLSGTMVDNPGLQEYLDAGLCQRRCDAGCFEGTACSAEGFCLPIGGF